MSNPEKNKNHASKFPEHGPLDENGREILLSLKNIDITFGKGERFITRVCLFQARFQNPLTVK